MRRRTEAPADDWLSEEIDWFQESDPASSRSVPGSDSADRAPGSSRIGLIPVGDPAARGQPFERARFLQVRRRRIAAIALLGLVFAAALAVPLVVFEGGGNAVEQTTPPTTAAPQATTTVEQPATTTTTQSTTPTAKPLRLALPDGNALRRGDRGSAVVTLQKALAALGFAAGEPDGVFGQVTQAAVIDFQRSNNLDPDGVVGTDTARLLNSALAKKGVTG